MRQTMLLLMVVCSMSWLTSPALGEQARAGVRQAQERLHQAGLDPGPADGVLGQRTAAALRQYQAAHGLPVTGELDEATWKVLRPAQPQALGSFSPSATLQATPPQQIREPTPVPMPKPLPDPRPNETLKEAEKVIKEYRQWERDKKTMQDEALKASRPGLGLPTPLVVPNRIEAPQPIGVPRPTERPVPPQSPSGSRPLGPGGFSGPGGRW